MSNDSPSENEQDTKGFDNELKLYGMLVDQIQKYSTIFWQFPVALLAANFFTVDKFLAHPEVLLALSLIDWVFVYALYRLVKNQRSIIRATRNAETCLRKKGVGEFIPTFDDAMISSPPLIVGVLALLVLGLTIFSICQMSLRASAGSQHTPSATNLLTTTSSPPATLPQSAPR